MLTTTLYARTTTGKYIPLQTGRNLRFSASTVFDEPLVPTVYNGGIHLADAFNKEDIICSQNGHINTTTRISPTTVKVNNSGSRLVTTLTSADAPLRIIIVGDDNFTMSSVQFALSYENGDVPNSEAVVLYEIGSGVNSWTNASSINLTSRLVGALTQTYDIALSVSSLTPLSSNRRKLTFSFTSP